MDDAESFDSFIVAEPSSRKRKSLLPANKTANSTSSELDILEEDQTTVSKKRRSVLLKTIQDRTANRSRLQSRNETTVFLSENQIEDQYEYAMKLHMGNKINDKNVFSLNLKLAEAIFQRYQKGGDVNFQRAAMDVEAGFKIWSYRVDAVHKDCTQAVKDLIETNAALSQDEDAIDEDDAEGEQGKDEKKRRKRKLQSVVYDEPGKISDKKLIEIKNPYLAIRAAKLDSATDISELKLSTSGVDGLSAGIHPNDDAHLIPTKHDEPTDNEFTCEWIDDILDDFADVTKEIETMKDIAPSFSTDSLGNHLTTPVPAQMSQRLPETHEEPPPLTFEPDDDEQAGFDDVDYGDMDEQLPVPPSLAENEAEVRSIVGDDVASHIFGHANVESDNISVVGSTGNPPASEPMDLDDARSTISGFSAKSGVSSTGSLRSIDMYTGNNKFLANVFDMSTKFRKPRLPPRIVQNNGEFKAPLQQARTKRKRVKVADRANQDIDLDAEWDDAIIYQKVGKSRRKKTATDKEKFLISEAEMSAIKSARADDVSSTLEYCLREMRFICIGYNNATEEEVENDEPEIPCPPQADSDHESDNEPLSNLINNFSKLGDDYDDDLPEAFDPPSDELIDNPPSGEGLPVPNVDMNQSLLKVKQVDKIKMNYDKRARRVNVRTVKREMWNIIEDARDKSLSEEKENMENDAEPDENVQATTFRELRSGLDDKLEGDNKDNLTPAMALVCVLYLANEKNLELEQADDSSDFLIRAPTTKTSEA